MLELNPFLLLPLSLPSFPPFLLWFRVLVDVWRRGVNERKISTYGELFLKLVRVLTDSERKGKNWRREEERELDQKNLRFQKGRGETRPASLGFLQLSELALLPFSPLSASFKVRPFCQKSLSTTHNPYQQTLPILPIPSTPSQPTEIHPKPSSQKDALPFEARIWSPLHPPTELVLRCILTRIFGWLDRGGSTLEDGHHEGYVYFSGKGRNADPTPSSSFPFNLSLPTLWTSPPLQLPNPTLFKPPPSPTLTSDLLPSSSCRNHHAYPILQHPKAPRTRLGVRSPSSFPSLPPSSLPHHLDDSFIQLILVLPSHPILQRSRSCG